MERLQQQLKEIFPKLPRGTKAALERKGIFSAEDMLYHLPARYEKRSRYLNISQASQASHEDDELLIPTIKASCEGSQTVVFRTRRIKKYLFHDGEDMFSVLAFNPFQTFKENETYLLSGKLKLRKNEVHMTVAEYEVFREDATEKLGAGSIIGIYSSTQYLTQKRLRALVKSLLAEIPESAFRYAIDESLLRRRKLQTKKKNIAQQHFPKNFASLEKARRELVYEEFYILQKKLAEDRKNRIQGKDSQRYHKKEMLERFIKTLPFKLSPEQHSALQDILADMNSGYAMQRLIQGEVGSGKTILALLAMYYAHINGYQSALMAPTEILVLQHEGFFKQLLKPLGVPLLTILGGQTPKEREIRKQQLQENPDAIVLGTHALIQESIEFGHLALCIIDEQQRFGVEQRKIFLEKGPTVDFLSLSATPIPRSLCLTLFGDMERSEIRKKPNTDLEVKTRLLSEDQRLHAYRFLYSRLSQGEQGYVVFPIIDESKSLQLRSLSKEYKRLTAKAFSNIETGFIHGRMKSQEKESLMQQFYSGKIKVLFSTSVMEVGISHDNATVIIIESAQQFGLSQLHQLRGRVGRAEKQGYCYLISQQTANEQSFDRLQKFTQTTNGFEIANLDLALRGPGEVLGQKQSGSPEFKIGNIITDINILLAARKDARALVLGKNA